jgi:hypothetical protein
MFISLFTASEKSLGCAISMVPSKWYLQYDEAPALRSHPSLSHQKTQSCRAVAPNSSQDSIQSKYSRVHLVLRSRFDLIWTNRHWFKLSPVPDYLLDDNGSSVPVSFTTFMPSFSLRRLYTSDIGH